MVALIVDLRIKPEAVDLFLEGMGANRAAALADEPGCVGFDIYRDVDDPYHYVLHERYVDRAAVDEHRQAPHFLRWRETAAACLAAAGVTTLGDEVLDDQRPSDQEAAS